jgi:hypothetical protein
MSMKPLPKDNCEPPFPSDGSALYAAVAVATPLTPSSLHPLDHAQPGGSLHGLPDRIMTGL